jgi:hypothetical protein
MLWRKGGRKNKKKRKSMFGQRATLNMEMFEIDNQAQQVFNYVSQRDWSVWTPMQQTLSILQLINGGTEEYTDPAITIPRLQTNGNVLGVSEILLRAVMYKIRLNVPVDMASVRYQGQLLRCVQTGRVYTIVSKSTLKALNSTEVVTVSSGLYANFNVISRTFLRTLISTSNVAHVVTFHTPRLVHFAKHKSSVPISGDVVYLRCNEPGNVGIWQCVLPTLSGGVFQIQVELNVPNVQKCANIKLRVDDVHDMEVLVHEVRLQNVTCGGQIELSVPKSISSRIEPFVKHMKHVTMVVN